MGQKNAFEIQSRKLGYYYLPVFTLTIVLTSFTMMTYATIVTVAVPNVMGAFGIGQDKAQLLATGFYISMTVSQLICAWLILTIGHYYTFIISIILFLLACFIGAFSNDYSFIIISRLIQGFSAGILMSQTMVAVVQAYPVNRRGYALSMFTIGGVLAIGIGPVLGGIIIEELSWREIFLIPIPLLFILIILGYFVMPRPTNIKLTNFDWVGLSLLIICLYSAMTIFSDGQRQGWGSNYIAGLLTIGIITGIAFVFWQLGYKYRLLDFSLFKYPIFTFATAITFCVGMGNFGAIYAIPIFAQIIQTFSPVDAGLLMLPASLITIAVLPLIGKLSDIMSARAGSIIGLLCFFIGTIPMIYADSNTSFLFVMGFVILTRLGMGINNPFVAKAAISCLPTAKIADGTSTLNFFRLLGTSLGTTAWVVFLEIRTQMHTATFSFTQTGSNNTSLLFLQEVKELLKQTGLSEFVKNQSSLDYLGKVIHSQGSALGFQDGFLIFAIIFGVAIIPAILMVNKK